MLLAELVNTGSNPKYNCLKSWGKFRVGGGGKNLV